MTETNCRSRNGSDGNATSENEQGLMKGATEELFVEAPSRAKSHGPTDRQTYTKKTSNVAMGCGDVMRRCDVI